MEGWVGLVGWPIADNLPTQWSVCRARKVHGPKTGILTTKLRCQHWQCFVVHFSWTVWRTTWVRFIWRWKEMVQCCQTQLQLTPLTALEVATAAMRVMPQLTGCLFCLWVTTPALAVRLLPVLRRLPRIEACSVAQPILKGVSHMAIYGRPACIHLGLVGSYLLLFIYLFIFIYDYAEAAQL